MDDLSRRILDFPVRSSAVNVFLHDLRFRAVADLSALEAAINDRRLSDQLLDIWTERGWVRRAPESPMRVFVGEKLTEDLTLAEFCGEPLDESREPTDFPNGSA